MKKTVSILALIISLNLSAQIDNEHLKVGESAPEIGS